jgi:hypothetical protein
VKAITTGSIANGIETQQGGWRRASGVRGYPSRRAPAEGGAYARKDEGFGQGLANESPTAAPHGGTHGEFTFAQRRTDQHEIGDVGASDQQEEDDGAHQS